MSPMVSSTEAWQSCGRELPLQCSVHEWTCCATPLVATRHAASIMTAIRVSKTARTASIGSLRDETIISFLDPLGGNLLWCYPRAMGESLAHRAQHPHDA